MLRKVAGRVDERARELERQREALVPEVEVQRFGMLFLDALAAVTPDRAGEPRGDVFAKPERLADFADGAARTITRDDCGQRAAGPAIGLVDPLDDFLAPLMLEVDIDIGRLPALGADEAFEQEFGPHRIDRSDTKDVTDRAVRRAAAALAENLAAAGFGDDRVNRQEIRGVIEFSDQSQLMLELSADLGADAFGVADGSLLPCQPLKLLLRGASRNLDLVGILVTQFFETEGAARREIDRAGDRRAVLEVAAEQALHLGRRLDVAVGEALAAITKLVDRAFLPDAGDDILQQAPVGHVIEDVARCERRHFRFWRPRLRDRAA